MVAIPSLWSQLTKINICRLVVLSVCLTAWVEAEDWPQFRGPEGKGISETSRLPHQFGPDRNLAWKIPLPPGHSSPILSHDRIFVTAYLGEKLITIALNKETGEELWRTPAPRPRKEAFHISHGPASPSPVTDGENVYVFFGDFGLLSYDRLGRERWRLPLGPFNNANGHGSSPILADGLLVLICDQDTDSYLIAVDPDTGMLLWQANRPEVTRGYATPGIFRSPGKPVQLIVPGSYQTIAYDLSTGEKTWWVTRMAWQVKCIPVIGNGTIYINTWEGGTQKETLSFQEALKQHDTNNDGVLSANESPEPMIRKRKAWREYDLDRDGVMGERDWFFYKARRSPENSLVAIRPDNGRGDLTETHVLWRHQKALPNTPSPLLYKEVLFLVKDGGILTSLDSETGTVIKQGRLRDAMGRYWASPVGGDGKLYTVNEDCDISVLSAQGEWEILATNKIGNECLATPAISSGRIFVRTRDTLYSFSN